MSSMYLPAFRSNAAHDAGELLPRLLRIGVTLKDTLAFCRHCRIRGIAGLFLDGIPEPLHQELCRSGRALLHALPRMRAEDRATGRLFPFLDAIAAGDGACAYGIATLSCTTWSPEEEYEDDFLYMSFLMHHFFLGADRAACEALLERWEALLDGAADVRLDLCRALFLRAGADFEAALSAWLKSEKARYQRLRRAGALSQEIDATEASLSVEGIALVRLARSVGLTTRPDFWGVPSIALKDVAVMFTGDAWQSL